MYFASPSHNRCLECVMMYVKRSPPVQSSSIMYLLPIFSCFSGKPVNKTTYKNSGSELTAYTLLILGCSNKDYGVQNKKMKLCTNVVEVHEQCCLLHLLFEVMTFLAPDDLAGSLLMTCCIKCKLHGGIATTPKTVRRDKESTKVLHKLFRTV